MIKFTMPLEYKLAHQFSSNNKDSVSKSKYCGCFHCLSIFEASEVKDFLEKENTAICPRCGLDSVICDCDVEFDKRFLEEMRKEWF